jgi:hypothetical protein
MPAKAYLASGRKPPEVVNVVPGYEKGSFRKIIFSGDFEQYRVI